MKAFVDVNGKVCREVSSFSIPFVTVMLEGHKPLSYLGDAGQD